MPSDPQPGDCTTLGGTYGTVVWCYSSDVDWPPDEFNGTVVVIQDV